MQIAPPALKLKTRALCHCVYNVPNEFNSRLALSLEAVQHAEHQQPASMAPALATLAA